MSRYPRGAGAYLIIVVFLLGFAATVLAANPALLSYRGGDQGPVVFDHRLHAARGFCCFDCHTNYAGTGKQLFQTRKRGLIDRAVHDRDESCFACHNGTVASADCETCHRQIR